jgi:hypothetical protein
MWYFVPFATASREANLVSKSGETGTFSEHMLVEDQDIRICINIISKFKLRESILHIIQDQSLLHHIENALDEPDRRFVTVQWKLVIHVLFEITEKTQVKALKYVARLRRES